MLEMVDGLGALKLNTQMEAAVRRKIGDVFGQLRVAIGPVSASKVLHILKPELFVPWDTDIRRLYNVDAEKEDYLTFLEHCRNQLLEVAKRAGGDDELKDAFYHRGWKPMTKLLDEMNWAKVRKLPPHFD